MPFNIFRVFKRRRLARAGLGVLVLAGAAFAQYKLAHVPRPVDVATIKDLSPANVASREELIFEGLVINSSEGTFFSHHGQVDETVDVIFDRAQLDLSTVTMFESYGFGLKPPATPARITYKAQESTPSSAEPCRTRVEVRTSSPLPTEVHFSQFDVAGSNRDRYLEMRARGATLTALLLTDAASDSDLGPGCRKLLSVGDWKQALASGPLTINVTEDSSLRIYSTPRTAQANLWAATQGFLPLALGTGKQDLAAPPIQVRAVSIRSLGSGGSSVTRISVRSPDNSPLLTISGLSVGPDQIQLSIAGKGYVEVRGEAVTVDFLKRMLDAPVLLALFVAANSALLAWVARLVFKSPPTPLAPKEE